MSTSVALGGRVVGIRFSSDAIIPELASELTADADPAVPPNVSVLVGGDAAAGSTGKHLLYSQGHLVGAFRSAEALEAAMLRAIGELAAAAPGSTRLRGIPVICGGRAAVVDTRLAGALERAERRVASAGIEVARGVRSVAIDADAQAVGVAEPSAVLESIRTSGVADNLDAAHQIALLVLPSVPEHATPAERLAQLMPWLGPEADAEHLGRLAPLAGNVVAPSGADAVGPLLEDALLA